jgi:hypothetical protein
MAKIGPPATGSSTTTTTTSTTTTTKPKRGLIGRVIKAIGIFIGVFVAALFVRLLAGLVYSGLYWIGFRRITIGDGLAQFALDVVFWGAIAAAVLFSLPKLGGARRKTIWISLGLVLLVAAAMMNSPASRVSIAGSQLGRTVQNQVIVEKVSPAQTGRTLAVAVMQNNEVVDALSITVNICKADPGYSHCSVWIQGGHNGTYSLSTDRDNQDAHNLIAAYCVKLALVQEVYPEVSEGGHYCSK